MWFTLINIVAKYEEYTVQILTILKLRILIINSKKLIIIFIRID